MENMSEHTSSQFTNDLISQRTLTDSKIIENLGAPSSSHDRSRAESKPSNTTYSPKPSISKDDHNTSIDK